MMLIALDVDGDDGRPQQCSLMGQVPGVALPAPGIHCMAENSQDTFEPFDLQSNHECPKSQGEVGR